jgi:hypothetical protein
MGEKYMKKTAVLVMVFSLTGNLAKSETADSSIPIESTGPGSYEILKKSIGPVRTPFRMHHGKPLLDLEINDKPATMMIDNGILWNQVWLFGSPWSLNCS